MEIRNIQVFKETESLKQELFDLCHPIDEVYTQYPTEEPPEEHYNKNGITSSWEELNYDGAFFRAAGGNADSFIEEDEELVKQEGCNKSHTHTVDYWNTDRLDGSTTDSGYHYHWFSACKTNRGNLNYAVCASYSDTRVDYTDVSPTTSGSHSHSPVYVTGCKHTHTCLYDESSNLGTEFRPVNFTIKIWKRIA